MNTLTANTKNNLSSERLAGFDALRFFMIFLTIMNHSAIPYMQNYKLINWHSVSDDKYLFFDAIVGISQTFGMYVFLFISGYFAPLSFNRKGMKSFINDKIIHIAIPWVLGVLLMTPVLTYPIFLQAGRTESFSYFFFNVFWNNYYNQMHYWFLGVLLFCFLLFVLFANFLPIKERISGVSKTPIVLLVALCIVFCISYYIPLHYISPFGEAWTKVYYLLYFQTTKITGYVLIFFLGIYAWKMCWFTKDGWIPNLTFWTVLGIVSMTAKLLWWGPFNSFFDKNTSQLVETLSQNIAAISFTIFLCTYFSRPKKYFTYISQEIGPYTFGIFWIHNIVIYLIMVNLLTLSPFIAYPITVIGTTVISFLITKYGFKKTPLLKKIF